jgi:membrane fusion protein, multidrug efflux system
VRAWIALAALALVGCPPGSEGGHKGGGHGPGGPPAAVAVAVEAARAEAVEETLLAHAALEAEAEVQVVARAEGEVLRVTVEAGDAVEAGQELAALDDTRAQLSLRKADLALSQAHTSLSRTRQLSEQGLISQEELTLAEQGVQQAELDKLQAQRDLDDTKLISPRAGVVVERLITQGAQMQRGAVAFRVADRDPLLARARVPEAQAGRLETGQRAWIDIEGRDRPLEGEVIRISPLVDMESGTVVATVALSRGTEGVRLNRFATVRIVVDKRDHAVTIPQAALALRGEEDRVLVFEPTEGGLGVVRLRDVVTGVREGERVEILRGLSEGEQVITAAPDDVREGAEVRAVERDD